MSVTSNHDITWRCGRCEVGWTDANSVCRYCGANRDSPTSRPETRDYKQPSDPTLTDRTAKKANAAAAEFIKRIVADVVVKFVENYPSPMHYTGYEDSERGWEDWEKGLRRAASSARRAAEIAVDVLKGDGSSCP